MDELGMTARAGWVLTVMVAALVACAHEPRQRNLASAPVSAEGANIATEFGGAYYARFFPRPEILGDWRLEDGMKKANLDGIPKAKFACKEGGLYPTHPQQLTKQYAVHLTGHYDVAQLRGDDDLCLQGQKKFSGPKPACFRATNAEYFVQSDLYRDRCGNVYRGYWEKTFLTRDENMGHLWALGRWQTVDGQVGALTATDQSTYEVDPKEFLFLSPASEKDLQHIERNRADAAKAGFQFNEQTLLFEKP